MLPYHKNHEYISTSFLKEYIKSPIKAITRQSNPVETEALILGRCFHEIMEDVRNFYVMKPDNRPEPDKTFASNANKAWKLAIYEAHETVISLDDAIILEAMTAAIKSSNFYKNLQSVKFEGAEKEYYIELPNGKAKCKPDALYHGKDNSLVCVDWKTTSESLTNNEYHVKRILNKYSYGIQAVHYTEVLKQATGKDVNFFFCFVEKADPFDVLPVYINPQGEYYNHSFEIWNEAMQRASESIKSGVYPTLEQITKFVEI